ncbi:MAG: HEPN domain-containing protein [Eubacteriales bacterium]
MVDTKRYNDWVVMAEKDLRSAKILFEHDADYGIVCFHCQQAILETRYPAEDPMLVAREDVEECFRIAEAVISKLTEEIGETE